ncbi:MAG TPA: hypothetical protein VFX23_10970 [Limnobacter sp.]|uniref:hypothetical protein n=1 Tax=Limnobacter sp. TaxID=2003368 RepID=UPI002E36EE9F|nr:hypothetical protein [Limnobacter sp.]HEX5486506.1 hypothetical protein [Limnobacter sp.]
MDDLQVFLGMMKSGGFTGAVAGFVLATLTMWLKLKQLNRTGTEVDAETKTYKLLVEDNQRLAGIVASLSSKIQELETRYHNDMENMQKQLFAERTTCFEEMSQMRKKLERLESRIQDQEDSNS